MTETVTMTKDEVRDFAASVKNICRSFPTTGSWAPTGPGTIATMRCARSCRAPAGSISLGAAGTRVPRRRRSRTRTGTGLRRLRRPCSAPAWPWHRLRTAASPWRGTHSRVTPCGSVVAARPNASRWWMPLRSPTSTHRASRWCRHSGLAGGDVPSEEGGRLDRGHGGLHGRPGCGRARDGTATMPERHGVRKALSAPGFGGEEARRRRDGVRGPPDGSRTTGRVSSSRATSARLPASPGPASSSTAASASPSNSPCSGAHGVGRWSPGRPDSAGAG